MDASYIKMEGTIFKRLKGNGNLIQLVNGTPIAKLVPFIGLFIVTIFFAIVTKGNLLSSRNAEVLFNEIFSIGLGSAGVIFVMAQGHLDFSIGAIVGLSATMGAFAAKIDTIYILPACLLTGVLVGVFNGVLYSKFGISAFIATLGMSFIVRGVTTVLLNGSLGIPYAMSKYDNFGLKAAVFVLALVVLYVLYEYTIVGKSTRAIGSLPEAARQSGVKMVKYKLLSFVISGFISSLVGFFSLIRSSTASSTTGAGFEFNVLLAMMIGGFSLTGGWTAKFRCAVIGSIIMGIIANGMTLWEMTGLAQQMIKGILFIAAVIISFDRKNVAIIK